MQIKCSFAGRLAGDLPERKKNQDNEEDHHHDHSWLSYEANKPHKMQI